MRTPSRCAQHSLTSRDWCAHRAPAEDGTVLLMILMSLFALGLMSMVVAQVASTEINITANIRAGEQSFLPADGAAQILLRDLIEMSRTLGRFPSDAELKTIAPPAFNNVALSQFTATADGPLVASTMASGLYIGLSAEIQPFVVLATAETSGPPESSATVEIQGEFAAIPIFQFGVLYEGDLDVHPGPVMQIGGRVHTNSNLFVDPSSELSFLSTVTAHGDIYNTREYGYTTGGTVMIADATGTNQAMAGLDSSSPDWSSEAISRWDGRVRSGDIGADRLDLVIADPSNPRLIIEAGRGTDTAADMAAKIWYDADLRIVNGRGYDNVGNLVSLVDPYTNESALRYTVLYDWREQKHMLTVEVDVDKLGRAPGYPANGIIYMGAFQPDAEMPAWPIGGMGMGMGWSEVGPIEWSGYSAPWSSSTTEFGFKLRHGSQLDSALAVVTENPVYMQGDFNTIDKRPAAIMADAVTMLSNKWGDIDGDGHFDGDLDYSLLDVADRTARSTTMNAAFMTGNVDAGVNYNGGLENLPRLMERWSNVRLTLLGSLAALWESQYANGAFGNNNVYSAGIRDWYFDTDFLDLNKLPPATPRIYKISVTSWEHR